MVGTNWNVHHQKIWKAVALHYKWHHESRCSHFGHKHHLSFPYRWSHNNDSPYLPPLSFCHLQYQIMYLLIIHGKNRNDNRIWSRQAFDASDFVFHLAGSDPGSSTSACTMQGLDVTKLQSLAGQGVAYTLFTLEPCGGINLPHVHPRATEIIHVISGENLRIGWKGGICRSCWYNKELNYQCIVIIHRKDGCLGTEKEDCFFRLLRLHQRFMAIGWLFMRASRQKFGEGKLPANLLW